jgi:hypothetical protein
MVWPRGRSFWSLGRLALTAIWWLWVRSRFLVHNRTVSGCPRALTGKKGTAKLPHPRYRSGAALDGSAGIWTMLMVMLVNCSCAKRIAAPSPAALRSAPACEAGQIRMSEILITVSQPDELKQVVSAQRKAEELRADIRRGGVFTDVARANSQGMTAARGGAMGCFRHGQLAQSLENLVFGMKVCRRF